MRSDDVMQKSHGGKKNMLENAMKYFKKIKVIIITVRTNYNSI